MTRVFPGRLGTEDVSADQSAAVLAPPVTGTVGGRPAPTLAGRASIPSASQGTRALQAASSGREQRRVTKAQWTRHYVTTLLLVDALCAVAAIAIGWAVRFGVPTESQLSGYLLLSVVMMTGWTLCLQVTRRVRPAPGRRRRRARANGCCGRR